MSIRGPKKPFLAWVGGGVAGVSPSSPDLTSSGAEAIFRLWPKVFNCSIFRCLPGGPPAEDLVLKPYRPGRCLHEHVTRTVTPNTAMDWSAWL